MNISLLLMTSAWCLSLTVMEYALEQILLSTWLKEKGTH